MTEKKINKETNGRKPRFITAEQYATWKKEYVRIVRETMPGGKPKTDIEIVRQMMRDGKLKVKKREGHHADLIDSRQAPLMTAKEFARHIDAEVRTVHRWMRTNLLEYKGDTGHHAHLIDSSQPRPKKKRLSHDERFQRNHGV